MPKVSNRTHLFKSTKLLSEWLAVGLYLRNGKIRQLTNVNQAVNLAMRYE